MEDFTKELEIVPFDPPFDKKKDAKKLKSYAKKYKTRWGIKSSHERIIITCKK
jgi:hypothetical protein